MGLRTQKVPRARKHRVASGAIASNGVAVRGLVFDTTRRKPPPLPPGVPDSPLRGVAMVGVKKPLPQMVQQQLAADILPTIERLCT
ncbi:hypothetical protein KVV02_002352 [Mortierella alpina]|uniref:Uncharacterized protein n=1 Tax=Mortierella alpina TaxID=64518 RepID=A0A9P8CZV7_MORAP|nr:hypothetical protein KVV02_002352 [Mortierella alpina]